MIALSFISKEILSFYVFLIDRPESLKALKARAFSRDDLSDHQDAAAVRRASSRRRSADRRADVRGRDRRKHEALAIISAGRSRSVAEGRLGTNPAALRRSSRSHGSGRVPAGPRRGSALR